MPDVLTNLDPLNEDPRENHLNQWPVEFLYLCLGVRGLSELTLNDDDATAVEDEVVNFGKACAGLVSVTKPNITPDCHPHLSEEGSNSPLIGEALGLRSAQLSGAGNELRPR